MRRRAGSRASRARDGSRRGGEGSRRSPARLEREGVANDSAEREGIDRGEDVPARRGVGRTRARAPASRRRRASRSAVSGCSAGTYRHGSQHGGRGDARRRVPRARGGSAPKLGPARGASRYERSQWRSRISRDLTGIGDVPKAPRRLRAPRRVGSAFTPRASRGAASRAGRDSGALARDV